MQQQCGALWCWRRELLQVHVPSRSPTCNRCPCLAGRCGLAGQLRDEVEDARGLEQVLADQLRVLRCSHSVPGEHRAQQLERVRGQGLTAEVVQRLEGRVELEA